MPHQNRFRHQTYSSTCPGAPHYLVSPEEQPTVGSDEFRRRMRAVGQSLRGAGVAAIYLSHGTFVGPDALGVLGELARILPSAAKAVHRFVPLVMAKLTGEAGNDTASDARLLHFVHHRPREGLPVYRAPFPPRLDRVLHAADGDYVQQLGIAGTNVCPSVFSWRAWLADRRLHQLLQEEAGEAGTRERFQAGAIVPQEGTTLLVDYGPQRGSIARHHAGHAVCTRKEWMLFHVEETVRRFYAERASQVA